MSDQTGDVIKFEPIDNPEQASTNFYWTYEYMTPQGQSQVFNFQTTFRGVLSLGQMANHIRMALEGTAYIAGLGGLAKQVGKSAYETPAAPLPQPTPIDQIITEQANLPFPTEEPNQPKPTGNTFMAEHLAVNIANGKKYFKVKGGQWSKYGVTVWDEVLVKAGIPTGKLEAQEYNLKDYKATYVLKADGKPDKVILLEKVA